MWIHLFLEKYPASIINIFFGNLQMEKPGICWPIKAITRRIFLMITWNLSKPVRTRFIKLENIHMPTGKFAISGLRVFGKGAGQKPDTVKQFIVLRSENDSRNALIKWITVNNATGYNIYWGIAPDKLYNNVMVYNDNQYYFKPMDKGRTYYFSIESFNENGISEKTKPIEVKAPKSEP